MALYFEFCLTRHLLSTLSGFQATAGPNLTIVVILITKLMVTIVLIEMIVIKSKKKTRGGVIRLGVWVEKCTHSEADG